MNPKARIDFLTALLYSASTKNLDEVWKILYKHFPLACATSKMIFGDEQPSMKYTHSIVTGIMIGMNKAVEIYKEK